MTLAVEELLNPATSSYKKRDLLRKLFEEFEGKDNQVQQIRQVLAASENNFRRDILDLLSRYQIQEFLDDIMNWLDGEDAYLIRDVLNYLEKNGTAQCIDKVESFTEHSSYTVNYAAKRCLESLQKKFPKLESSNEEQTIDITVEDTGSVDVSSAKVEEEKNSISWKVDASSPVTKDPGTVDVPSAKVEDAGTVDVPSAKVKEIKAIKENNATQEATLKSSEVLGELQLENDFANKDLEYVAEECYQKIFLEEQTWKQAKSLKLFFGADFEQAKELYQKLYAALTQYPALEHKIHHLTMDLQLYQADKEDDIFDSEEAITESRNNARELDSEINKIRTELTDLKAKRESFFNGIVNTLFSDREMDQEQLQRSIETRLEEKENAERQAQETIEKQQEAKQSLLKPLQTLKKSISDKTAEKKKLERQIEKYRIQLWKFFANRLISLENEERHEILEKLTSQSPNPQFFKQVCIRLSENIQKLTLLEKSLLESRTELKRKNADASNAVNDFADTLSRGFIHKTEVRHCEVKMNAEIYFSEEKGFFGFSGADGRASGKGKTQVSYDIDHLQWQSPQELNSNYAALLIKAQEEGQEAAKVLKLEWQHKALELNLRNELLYFRKTLEKELYV